MDKVHCECRYCGKKWEQYLYLTRPKCEKCGDSSIIVRKNLGKKVDYYADDAGASPPEADYTEFTD